MMNRRSFLATSAGAIATPAIGLDPAAAATPAFPRGFLWGAATAGHQVEGNNTNSDQWLLENVTPTITGERSGDAVNSLERWADDLDLVKSIGLNSYRFSLEWSRIEPDQGQFSLAMLDHYKAMVDGCRARGITPVLSFNHFATPRWFAAQGGWLHPQSPALFARFCERAARHLAAGVEMATTLNEPNIGKILSIVLPPQFVGGLRANLAAAARAANVPKFVVANTVPPEDVPLLTANMVKGHKAARDAIKGVRPDLPVGVTLAVADDQAVGANSLRDAKRAELHGDWLAAVKGDDFVGVQNYERFLWDDKGLVAPPSGGPRNFRGAEVYPPSLAGAVRYIHEATGRPILVSEHGVGTADDRIRAALIPAALKGLKVAMDEGVPVKGYIHWSLLDNYEWGSGFDEARFGLCSVDRTTWKRTPKPSAGILGTIARRNAL
ncbi:family 1 glycosylhydrolase [Sphingomonas sp. MG17]|uniref:Family 1 glycosylhydrolase n=1 Tax=Sphingomonas tagetis TaxID=2949092 RepID=A0A9X2HGB3_9SPHN|nr:family 1 glycosylhydrolase [Sphingomonas tagetis]